MHPHRRTWRVRGIPLHFDEKELAETLQNHSDLQCIEESSNQSRNDRTVHIHTLAIEYTSSAKVATVRFSTLPTRLSSLVNGEQLTIDLQVTQTDTLSIFWSSRLTIDDHFHGVTTLVSPLTEEHEIDVLVVPGLGSHPFGSFVHKGDGHMWLSDRLPQDVPAAGIMIYGYGSGLHASESLTRIGDLARSLQATIGELLEQSRKRIILIGHSLGGLLVKESLIKMFESKPASNLVNLIHGCIFFGVPNDGMDIDSLIHMVNDQPNHLLLQSLENLNPEFLRLQKRNFSRVSNSAKFEQFCFYETEMSPTAAKDPATGKYSMSGPPRCLVTAASATSCLPGEVLMDQSAPIARTHSDLVKFAHHDSEYNKVAPVIIQMYSTSLTVNGKRTDDVINSLYFPEMRNREHQIYEDVSEASDWIWANASFVDWISSSHCLFWISGKPGSGKSTLMKYICGSSHLEILLKRRTRSSEWVVVDFYFDFRAGTGIANSFDGFLRSLLLQLIAKMPRLAKTAGDFAVDDIDPRKHIMWNAAALRKAFSTVLSSAYVNICIFVDGLDEYEGSHQDLIEFFRGIESDTGQFQNSVKICLACRPEPLFEQGFHDIRSIHMQDHNKSSILRFLSARFQIIQRYQEENTEIIKLMDQITDLAMGVFLWARLVAEVIIRGIAEGETPTELQQSLIELPSDLEAVYSRMLRQLRERKFREASVILLLVSHATSILPLVTLYEAVNLAMGRDFETNGRYRPAQYSPLSIKTDRGSKILEGFAKRIRSHTCGLVEITQPLKIYTRSDGRSSEERRDPSNDPRQWEVRLIHQTVKVFLERPQALDFLQVRKGGNDLNPDFLWLKVCSQQLNYHMNWGSIDLRSKSSFPILDPLLTPRLLSRFRPVDTMSTVWSNKFATRSPDPERMTALGCAANTGLLLYCMDKIKSGVDPNENDSQALDLAMKGFHIDVMKMLIETGISVKDFHIIDALRFMHLDAVQVIVRDLSTVPVTLTHRSGERMGALYAIATTLLDWDNRAEELIRQFIQNGWDINAVSGPAGTPLNGAIATGLTHQDGTENRRLRFLISSGAKSSHADPGPIPDLGYGGSVHFSSNPDQVLERRF
ncbi:hypothetical protein F5Y04DRAFT_248400 [Hypomontagnella monticulosa]|nr:hypothetical protein F5Y04DRAFT_248400 [Hypomontagnella monticulosa]